MWAIHKKYANQHRLALRFVQFHKEVMAVRAKRQCNVRHTTNACRTTLDKRREPVRSVDRARLRTITLALLLTLLASALSSVHAGSQPGTLGTVRQVRVNPHTLRMPVTDRDDIQFSHISANAGLSQTRVAQIVQDDDGFLWFATQYGLNRYDGYNFKVFVHDPAKGNSLSCAYIVSLLKDRDGTVWVGCEHGIDRFDKATEAFVHYRIDSEVSHGVPVTVFHISQDHTGALWLSTGNGLYRLEPATARITHYGHDVGDSSSLSSSDVKSSGEDSSHRFWVADGDNLEEFDRERGKVLLRVPLAGDPLSPGLGEGYVSFYEDHLGVFWIFYTTSGYGSGLAVLDRGTNELTRYSINDRKSRRGLAGGVTAAIEDQYDTLWFATKSDGLLRFDREHGVFIRYQNHGGEPESLAEDRVISLFADREGNVWVGLHAMAPDFFQSKTRSFVPLLLRPSNPNSLGETFVNAIYEDHQGVLWVGATGALIRIDRRSGEYTTYPPPGAGPDNDIVAITEDRSGTLWVGSIGAGLASFDRNTRRFKTYRHHASDPSSLSDNAVSRMLVDTAGTMWVTTWNGLDRFDPVTGRVVVYRLYKQNQTERYSNVTQDQDGTLWLGGVMGLTHFEPTSGRVVLYSHDPDDSGSLSDDAVTNVYIDHSGTLWAGTENGLNRLNRESGTFTHYSAADGLPVNAVSCILEDRSGTLWISTARGLSRFHPRMKAFENYSQADGLPGNDLSGWDACFKSSAGEMFFGGFSGGVAFYPDKVESPSYIPPIVLTDFQLSGKSVAIGPHSLLKRSITYESDLTLSHGQSVFSLTFSALNYFNAAANRYRYMLEGLDREWTEVGSDRRSATYTTLPAGRYTFRVQGAARSGPWSEPGVKLRITILPPWWGTWSFRATVGLLIVLTAWLLYRLRIRQISRQLTIRMDERLGERARIAQELHDTVLQGLASASLQLEVADRQIPGDSTAKPLVQRISQMLRQLMDDSRHTVRGLRLRHSEEENLERALTQISNDLAAPRKVKYQVVVEGAPRSLRPLVRDEIYRIGGEALANAFRHAGASAVETVLEYGPDHFRLLVRDDGEGIDPEVLKAGREGHFGLSGQRERAAKIGARLNVRSGAGAGTEIDLLVPAVAAFEQPARRGPVYWIAKLYSRGSRP
jgi:signal transduction histidine kinase/ligand-binding sensor domain-containing protein